MSRFALSTRPAIATIALGTCLCLFGCGDGADGKAAPTGSAKPAAATSAKPAASTAKTTPSAAPAGSAQAQAEEDIPTEADFEEEAEKEITKDSRGDELAKLEKEIEGDKE